MQPSSHYVCLAGGILLFEGVGIFDMVGMRLALGIPLAVPVATLPEPDWPWAGLEELVVAWCLGEEWDSGGRGDTTFFPLPVFLEESETGVVLLAWLRPVVDLGGVLRVCWEGGLCRGLSLFWSLEGVLSLELRSLVPDPVVDLGVGWWPFSAVCLAAGALEENVEVLRPGPFFSIDFISMLVRPAATCIGKEQKVCTD